MSKVGEMMGNGGKGKVAVVDDYDVAEPEHYALIVLEDNVVYERSKNMPVLAIFQGAAQAALVSGVDKNVLTAFVEGIIEDIYNDTPKA